MVGTELGMSTEELGHQRRSWSVRAVHGVAVESGGAQRSWEELGSQERSTEELWSQGRSMEEIGSWEEHRGAGETGGAWRR